jgi:NADPH:quinone reductase-like Zn-dependent oxidoreductase
MKAIIINKPGGVENFEYIETAKPEINSDEVLVQIKAVSINPVDVKVRAGGGIYQVLKNEHPLILGWDISGVVIASGADAAFKPGDEVFGMIRFPGHGKAYAEYVAAPASQLAAKPANITHEQAAASTLATLTAYQAMTRHANVKPGQKVLVHAAAGGVGHFAVQIAKHLGAYVVGTSSVKNKDFVMSIGADEHIGYQGYDWKSSEIKYDFVMDTVGAENIDKSLDVVKDGGVVISIPAGLSESQIERAQAKNVNAVFFLVTSSGIDMEVLAAWLSQGIIKPHVSEVFDFNEMDKAHLQVESGRTVGKVVVRL